MTQEYVGTKIVTAWKQDGGPKVQVCGRDCVTGGESCNGYCVGENPHPKSLAQVPGYTVKADGVQAWMPEAEFNAIYTPIGQVSDMPEWQQRLIAEKAQLDSRRSALANFISNSAAFKALPEYERYLMGEQSELMLRLSITLGHRIDNIKQ